MPQSCQWPSGCAVLLVQLGKGLGPGPLWQLAAGAASGEVHSSRKGQQNAISHWSQDQANLLPALSAVGFAFAVVFRLPA